MNDDRIEPTLGTIDTEEENTPSLDTSADAKKQELSLDDDMFKIPSDKTINPKIDEDPNANEDSSIKIIPDRGRREIDKELAKPDIFESNLDDKAAYKDHNATPFSLFKGRIDRFHASVILVGASLFSLLLLVFFDAILYFVLSNTSGVIAENKYQADPLIYIGISAGLWLISLLIIAMGRLRDIGRSPLFAIFLYVPPLTFAVIYMTTLPGTPHSNKFGSAGGGYGLKTWLLAILFLGLLPVLAYMNWGNIYEYLAEIVKRFNPE